MIFHSAVLELLFPDRRQRERRREANRPIYAVSHCERSNEHHLSYATYLWLYSPLLDLGPWPHKRTQTSVPQVGFDSTIPVFERAKAVHALDRAAAVVGTSAVLNYKISGFN
jgi:hypothetical protein